MIHNPIMILNHLYYLLTDVRAGEIKKENDNQKGILSALSNLSRETKILELKEIVKNISEDKDCENLGELFTSHGSDKSTKHNYHLLYASILKGKRGLPLNILEIGLGTNNPNLPSSMRGKGVPGASLRAFREWGQYFDVYGADIDKDILFTENRIKTYFVDQTNLESLNDLAVQLPTFDLIIDDGLHTPWANLNTLNFALKLLKPSGYFVVEDIRDIYIPIWKITLSLLPSNYTYQLIRARKEIMLVIQSK